MATTLPGSPYVESSDLVAGYPGVSESLAERVDTVGVLPFADSTARGTALPSPTEGQYTYLQDTNATEYWDGAAWVASGVGPGLVIMSPSSIANSGGSASASGGEVTFTGVTSVSLNGVFTATYDNYFIYMTVVGGARENLSGRFRTGGTDNTAAVYQSQYVRGDGVSVSASRATNQTSSIFGAVDTSTCLLNISVASPFLSANTTATNSGNFRAATTPTVDLESFGHSSTTSFDGFTVYPTNPMTGKLRVYGYKNS